MLTVSSQIRPDKISGLMWIQNLFDNLMVFLEECFEKVKFEKKLADDKKHAKLPSMHANARLAQTSFAILVRIILQCVGYIVEV